MNMTFKILLGSAVLALTASAASASTLSEVKAKGYLQCGVSTGLAGFSNPDDKGNWSGLDVDYCRAMAAAIFGDKDKVRFTPLTAKERFTAIQSGDIDILSRNTTWTMDRDTSLGLNFAGITFFDGQGFMIRKNMNITSALQLSGASVCVQTGTTTELNLADYFKANNMTYESKAFENLDAVNTAYQQGACDVYTTDKSGLYAIRLTMSDPDEHMVLPETISKEPLGPAVRQGDDQWLDVAKWVYFALLNAEEYGIDTQNVDEMKKSDSPRIRRLLGTEGKFGESIGLSNDWAYNIVKMVGNYGEIYDRNVGKDSALKIDRGINNLWTKGGLQYGMPIR